MANPTKIAIVERGFAISLTPTQIATLPTVRYVDAGVDGYGIPTAGRQLCRLIPADVITDATVITSILGVTLQTGDYPHTYYPSWQDAH